MKNRFFFLFYFFIVYVCAASIWWGYLLYSKNEEMYNEKIELLQAKHANEQEGTDDIRFIMEKKARQNEMIIGEGIVYFVLLVGFIWLVWRSLQKEMELTQQQRNFILSITHELKSPLAAIKLVVETLIRRNLQKEQADKLCTNALQDVERLGSLVDNILMAARVESSSYELKKVQLDIGDFLDGMVENMKVRFPEAAIEFVEQVEDMVILEADRHALTSVIMNLIENGVKYAEKSPAVTIFLRLQGKYDLIIEVADNGVGIKGSDKERIFEKFYRVGNEDTRRTKGTGLGLYIVRELIRLHTGTIQVLDNQPNGSRFIIQLPLK